MAEWLINRPLIRIRSPNEVNALIQSNSDSFEITNSSSQNNYSLKQNEKAETSGNSVTTPLSQLSINQPTNRGVSLSSIINSSNLVDHTETPACSVEKPLREHNSNLPTNRGMSSSTIINSSNQVDHTETPACSVEKPLREHNSNQLTNRGLSSSTIINSSNQVDHTETPPCSVEKPLREPSSNQLTNRGMSSSTIINSSNKVDYTETPACSVEKPLRENSSNQPKNQPLSSLKQVNITCSIKSEVNETICYPKLRRSLRILSLNTHLRRSPRIMEKKKREYEYTNFNSNNTQQIDIRPKASVSKMKHNIKMEVKYEEPQTIHVRKSIRLLSKLKSDNEYPVLKPNYNIHPMVLRPRGCASKTNHTEREQKTNINYDPIPKLRISKKILPNPKRFKTEYDGLYNRPSTSSMSTSRSNQHEMFQDHMKEIKNSSANCENVNNRILPEGFRGFIEEDISESRQKLMKDLSI